MSLWVVDGGMLSIPVVARVEDWREGDFIELSGDDGGKWGEPVRYVAERTCHDKLADREPFECSECYRRTNDTKFPNYCWYCGAKVVE